LSPGWNTLHQSTSPPPRRPDGGSAPDRRPDRGRCITEGNCITLATVRSQLKSVFAKTSTHRQAEVIQLLLVAMLL